MRLGLMMLAAKAAICGLIASTAVAAAAGSPEPTVSSESDKAAITILYDAFGEPSAMTKDWGFSALIEYRGKRILFDTGNNADILAHNLEAKGVDPKSFDFVIVSHRHGDHTSGLNYLLEVNPDVEIYAPQENFGVFGSALPGTFYKRDTALPADMRYFDGKPPETLRFGSAWPKGKFNWVSKAVEVMPGFHLMVLPGRWGVDLEVKEISLAFETPDGVVVVVGCGHPTIEAIVKETQAITGKKIHLVVGGLHLLPASDEEIRRIAVSLRDEWKVDFIAPGHCTGERGFAILSEVFTDRYIYAGLGTSFELGPAMTTKLRKGELDRPALGSEDIHSYRAALVKGPYRALLGRGGDQLAHP